MSPLYDSLWAYSGKCYSLSASGYMTLLWAYGWKYRRPVYKECKLNKSCRQAGLEMIKLPI